MSQYITIGLEESISRLKESIGKLNKLSEETYEKIFSELRSFGLEFRGKSEALPVAFYEKRLGIPAFTRPESNSKDRRIAGIIINIYRIMCGKDYSKSTRFFDYAGSRHWWDPLLEDFSAWMIEENCSNATIETRRKHIRVFFRFLDSHGVASMEELVNEDFVSYLAYMDKKGFRLSSRSGMLSSLRVFLSSPVGLRHLSCNTLPLLLNIRFPKHDRLPSVYTAEEVKLLIGTIDRDTRYGKLMYAVVLLAAVYGIRTIDIVKLTFENIRWEENMISFIQHKTLKPVELPLIEEVRYALLDYIKNARTDSLASTIFVRNRAPYTAYSSFSTQTRNLFRTAGIEIGERHAGLHALRHSLATMLHSMATPINQIATILGHNTAQSTMTYIWSDVESLRLIAGEVPYADQL